MSKTLSLLKILLKQNLSFSKMKKKSVVSSFLLSAFIIISIIVYIYTYTNMGIDYLTQYSYQNVIPTISYILTFMLIIMSAFSKIKNILFDSKDNDLLICLPLKNNQIFMARIFSITVLNYGITFLIFFLCSIFYGIRLGMKINYYLFAIILTLFVPLIPTTISVILSYLVTILTSKIRNKKAFEIVLNFIIIGGIFIAMASFSSVTRNFIENATKIKEFFARTRLFYKNCLFITYKL